MLRRVVCVFVCVCVCVCAHVCAPCCADLHDGLGLQPGPQLPVALQHGAAVGGQLGAGGQAGHGGTEAPLSVTERPGSVRAGTRSSQSRTVIAPIQK